MSQSDDIIRLLPDAVANQIAAGEVIQRPASVVKELVENSVDAGASSIQIIIKDAGRTLIQVVDNGSGMSPSDARMAFERHATSKIAGAEDLFRLRTMGFRGEALPSIAAVAQIDLRTMRRGDVMGSRLKLSESRFESQTPEACLPGTNMMVKNLFFHLPARRKFLKKDSVELSHIVKEFERLALVNPTVELTLIHNDITLHSLSKGSIKQRIISLFGKALDSQIIPVEVDTPLVKISGFTGVPEHAKRRGAAQFFFVNGRNMRHPYFHKALLNCYSELISADAQPSYFIYLEVNPATIDVNIHPQKHEVKFENEQAICQILCASVREALGKINAAGAIDFNAADAPEIPIFMPDKSEKFPSIAFDEHYNPFDDNDVELRQGAVSGQRSAHMTHTTHPLPPDHPAHTTHMTQPLPLPPDPRPSTPDRYHISLLNKFIITAAADGLMIINRRRAHIRILFDSFMRTLADKPLPSQALLFPESLTLTPAESALLAAMPEQIARLGFDVSFLGDNVWAVNAVPALPNNSHSLDILHRLISDLLDSRPSSLDIVIEPAALSLARSAAILPGQVLADEETDTLIAHLFCCPQPRYTPDGLTIFHIIPNNDIARFFL